MLLKGVCQKPPVDPESKTGKGGGFIQMIPKCAEGTTFSESEGKCVATPAAEKQTSDDEGNYKSKKKKKKKGQYEDGSGYEKKKQRDYDDDDDDDDDRY